MATTAFTTRSNVPDEVTHRVRLLGANDAHPTAETGGGGITATRTGEGAYRVTFAESPGIFVGWACGLGAATPGDLAGYTAVRDTYDATNFRLDFVVYNSSFAAADLIANQYIDLAMTFKRTNVEG